MQDSKLNFLTFALILIPAYCLFFYNVELYGDIFQYLPLFLGISILVFERNLKRVLMLTIGASVVLGVVYMIKGGCVLLAANNMAEYIPFAKRPHGGFSGFPSGHTTSAFIAIGFAMRFYGNKFLSLLVLLAILVPLSRILTFWHTPLQVAVGALFGIFLTYIVVWKLQQIPFFQDFIQKK